MECIDPVGGRGLRGVGASLQSLWISTDKVRGLSGLFDSVVVAGRPAPVAIPEVVYGPRGGFRPQVRWGKGNRSLGRRRCQQPPAEGGGLEVSEETNFNLTGWLMYPNGWHREILTLHVARYFP